MPVTARRKRATARRPLTAHERRLEELVHDLREQHRKNPRGPLVSRVQPGERLTAVLAQSRFARELEAQLQPAWEAKLAAFSEPKGA